MAISSNNSVKCPVFASQPMKINESSPPFSWADLLQARNGRVNCRGREGRRDRVFVDMGFYMDKEDIWMVCGYGLLYFFLVKTMPFLFITLFFNKKNWPFCNCSFWFPKFFHFNFIFILCLHGLKPNNCFCNVKIILCLGLLIKF